MSREELRAYRARRQELTATQENVGVIVASANPGWGPAPVLSAATPCAADPQARWIGCGGVVCGGQSGGVFLLRAYYREIQLARGASRWWSRWATWPLQGLLTSRSRDESGRAGDLTGSIVSRYHSHVDRTLGKVGVNSMASARIPWLRRCRWTASRCRSSRAVAGE